MKAKYLRRSFFLRSFVSTMQTSAKEAQTDAGS